ncbi:MAG: GAF domain-containing sensor histidine kinase, partial [Candidatus Subteraquimicrobiales bacterium]|nr:GAF domain-containing sensor histidine kinase [Candidatus Subteraquimicrobiales bacterium]
LYLPVGRHGLTTNPERILMVNKSLDKKTPTTREAFSEVRKLRVFISTYRVLTLLQAGLFLVFILPQAPPQDFLIFLSAVLFNLILIFLYSKEFASRNWYALLVALDCFLAGALLYSTGGWRSPYFLYSFSPVLTAALFHKIFGALSVAVVQSVLYLVALNLNGYNFSKIVEMQVVDDWLANIFSYFLVGIFFALPIMLVDKLHNVTLRTERTKETLMNVTTALNLANKQLFSLQKISLELQAASTSKEILDVSLRGATKELGFEFAVIGLLDEREFSLTNWVTNRSESELGMSNEDLFNLKIPLTKETGVIAQAISERKALCLEGLPLASSKYKFLFQPPGLASFVVVPTIARNTVIGVMMVANPYSKEIIPYADMPFLVTFGTATALAILNARFYTSQSAQIEALTSVYEAAAAVASELEVEDVLNSIVDQVKTVTGSEKAVLFLFAEGKEEGKEKKRLKTASMVVRGSRGEHPEAWWRKPIEGLSARVAVSQQPEAILHKKRKKESWEWLLSVPLVIKGNTIGVISLINSYEHPFSDTNISTLTILSHLAAVAIENAKLASKMKRLTVVEERNRIAQEMHDGLAQSLFSLVLNLQACIKRLEIDPQSTKEKLIELQRFASHDLKEVRQYIYELRPSYVEEFGLVEALKKYTKGLGRIITIPIWFSVKGEKRALPITIEDNLFRCAQEAIGNALKHANPEEISVELAFVEGTVCLVVEDKGSGFDVKSTLKAVKTEGKVGLIGLKSRVQKIDGTVKIKSTLGKGTRIEVEVPLNV